MTVADMHPWPNQHRTDAQTTQLFRNTLCDTVPLFPTRDETTKDLQTYQRIRILSCFRLSFAIPLRPSHPPPDLQLVPFNDDGTPRRG